MANSNIRKGVKYNEYQSTFRCNLAAKKIFSESFVIGVKFKDEIERYFELLDECEETDLNPDDSIKFQQNLMSENSRF